MKKALIIAGVIIAAFFLFVAVFVAGIAGIAYYSIYNSDAAETARTFLRGNDKLKQEIGEVKEFGRLVSGQVNSGTAGGQATLIFTVYGERRSVSATVSLVSKENRGWRVTSAEYVNEQGRRVTLFDPYESAPAEPEAEPERTEPADRDDRQGDGMNHK